MALWRRDTVVPAVQHPLSQGTYAHRVSPMCVLCGLLLCPCHFFLQSSKQTLCLLLTGFGPWLWWSTLYKMHTSLLVKWDLPLLLWQWTCAAWIEHAILTRLQLGLPQGLTPLPGQKNQNSRPREDILVKFASSSGERDPQYWDWSKWEVWVCWRVRG